MFIFQNQVEYLTLKTYEKNALGSLCWSPHKTRILLKLDDYWKMDKNKKNG